MWYRSGDVNVFVYMHLQRRAAGVSCYRRLEKDCMRSRCDLLRAKPFPLLWLRTSSPSLTPPTPRS